MMRKSGEIYCPVCDRQTPHEDVNTGQLVSVNTADGETKKWFGGVRNECTVCGRTSVKEEVAI